LKTFRSSVTLVRNDEDIILRLLGYMPFDQQAHIEEWSEKFVVELMSWISPEMHAFEASVNY